MSLSPAWVCHVPIPCSNTDIYWQQHWSLYANADCGWMSVCVALCVCTHCLCEFNMLIHDTFSFPAKSQPQPISFCVTVEIQRPELYSLLRRERWHLPEAGAVHLQHCLRDLSSWSGMYGSLPPQQVSDASQHHISSMPPAVQKEHFTIMAWSPMKF